MLYATFGLNWQKAHPLESYISIIFSRPRFCQFVLNSCLKREGVGCNKESRHYLSELWSVVRVGVPAGVHQSPVLGHDLHWRPAGHRVGPCSLFNDLHHLMVEIHPLEILYEYQDSKIWFNVTFIRGKRHWQYEFFFNQINNGDSVIDVIPLVLIYPRTGPHKRPAPTYTSQRNTRRNRSCGASPRRSPMPGGEVSPQEPSSEARKGTHWIDLDLKTIHLRLIVCGCFTSYLNYISQNYGMVISIQIVVMMHLAQLHRTEDY